MLFNSYDFIFIFLPISLILFFIISKHNQNLSLLWLIFSSLFFYGHWDVKYIPLLLVSICINYFVSRKIEGSNSRKVWLISGIAFNFLVLGFFKYIGLLPLGISFYTFTQTAYIVEVYRSSVKTESLLKYCAYVSFFPYITSGPISNCKNIMPQLNDTKTFAPDWENIAKGLTLFILGLFKKVYLADGIASTVNTLFTNSEALTFLEAWSAALGYSMQLYFDFSGYSDMAVGLAMMFNINIPVNFDSPYKSLSIIDFWRRWHISLGAWIKDYIYIPLGGSREGELKKVRNVILCMLFTGLWHGTGWTFILWGAVHGVMLALNHQWRRLNLKLPAILSWLMTLICVIICWVIFRAKSISEALRIITVMFDFRHIVLNTGSLKYLGFLEKYGISFKHLISNHEFYFLVIMMMMISLFCSNTNKIINKFKADTVWLIVITILALVSFSNFSTITDFLYFQF